MDVCKHENGVAICATPLRRSDPRQSEYERYGLKAGQKKPQACLLNVSFEGYSVVSQTGIGNHIGGRLGFECGV